MKRLKHSYISQQLAWTLLRSPLAGNGGRGMPRIPEIKRVKVAKLFFNGYSYEEISRVAGISKGLVVNILKEVRDGKVRIPAYLLREIGELRAIAVRLKRMELTLSSVTNALRLLERLNEIGVDLEELELFIELAKDISAKRGRCDELIPAAVELLKLEKKFGKSLEDILTEAENISTKLKELMITRR